STASPAASGPTTSKTRSPRLRGWARAGSIWSQAFAPTTGSISTRCARCWSGLRSGWRSSARDATMSRADLKRNDRGFVEYGSGTCAHGIEWRVIESSIAGEHHAYLFADGVLPGGGRSGGRKVEGSLHLNVEQAKQLIAHLQRFVADAEDPEHWKNQPEYVA